jgi:hypothetical protein
MRPDLAATCIRSGEATCSTTEASYRLDLVTGPHHAVTLGTRYFRAGVFQWNDKTA